MNATLGKLILVLCASCLLLTCFALVLPGTFAVLYGLLAVLAFAASCRVKGLTRVMGVLLAILLMVAAITDYVQGRQLHSRWAAIAGSRSMSSNHVSRVQELGTNQPADADGTPSSHAENRSD
jgi:thiol:disulfide interchange protein